MYKANKSLSVKFVSVFLSLFFLTVLTSPVTADENYGNVLPDANMMMGMSSLENIDLPFDPNDYTFLIYESEGDEYQRSIEAAMIYLGIPYDLRGPGNEVTPEDLATHDILIVGWNAGGDTSGLHSNDLAAGITGRVILTGHDLDFHTANYYGGHWPGAEKMLIQAINYVLEGGGTGMITLGCTGNYPYTNGFPYLPEEWDVNAVTGGSEDINEFTPEGLDSGVFDGLDPCDMCGWQQSYHDTFTINQGSDFVPFELGGSNGDANVTVARTFGTLSLTSTAGFVGECVCPGDIITYNLTYGNLQNGTAYNIEIIDHLPAEVNFYSADGNGIYDANTRTVKWTIGNLAPGGEGYRTLTTRVNSYARPGGQISNFIEMTADGYYYSATNTVPVCNWGGKIIYVDWDANGYKNGTNWNDAYKDIQDALTAARNSSGYITAIWVAAGTYKPVNDVNISGYKNKSFELPDNVALIGHFGGIETSPDQRNFANAANETILEGQIGQSTWDAVNYIVKGQSINNALVDGFTIKGGCLGGEAGAGIYLNNVPEASIVNCKIKNNIDYGIYDVNSSPDIHNCTFSNNSWIGAYFNHCRPKISNCIFDGNNLTTYGISMDHDSSISVVDSTVKRHGYSLSVSGGTVTLTGSTFDSDYESVSLSDAATTMTDCSVNSFNYYSVSCSNGDLTIDHSIISGNDYSTGLWAGGCNLTLKNSIIRHCGNNGVELSGNLATTIKNNWIHNNGAAGISFTNQSSEPLVRNNTIYGNHTYGIWSSQQGEEPNIVNCIISGNDTDLCRENGSFSKVNYCLIAGSPGFMNPADINDLHIADTSQCKNAGDQNGSYGSETDIDGELRVCYGRVDIGGDEYYWSKADYNKDEIVDFNDFAALANEWKMQDAGISLDTDSDVDIYDLDLFCNDWLWEAGWTQGQWMMAMAGDGGADMSAAAMESISLLEADVAQAQAGDTLMLLDVKASLLAQPARLRARSQKFYEITPIASVPVTLASMSMSVDSETLGLAAVEKPVASEEPTEPQPITIEELVDWLDEIWQAGELTMSEEEYLDFRNDLEESTR